MKAKCFLVIQKVKPKNEGDPDVRVKRATTKRPMLSPKEALIALDLEIPEDAFEAPLVFVPVEKRHVGVAADPQELSQDDWPERKTEIKTPPAKEPKTEKKGK